MTDIKEQFLNEFRQALNDLEKSTRPSIKNEKWGDLKALAERGSTIEFLSNESVELLNQLANKDEYKTLNIKDDIELFENVKDELGLIIQQRIKN
jgi:hypothetical protein